MLFVTIGPLLVGALVEVCDKHPGHAECMVLVCRDKCFFKLGSMKITGCQICAT